VPDADQPRDRDATYGRVRTTLVSGTVALILAAGTVAGLDATGHLPESLDRHAAATPTSTPTPKRTAAEPVLAAATTDAAVALPAARLRTLLQAKALGPRPGAVVLDATTGELLLDLDSTTARTPASVAKLATTAAALHAIGPGRRLTTKVVTGAAPGEVVLVGAGDATLTVARPRPTDYPQRASLAVLADATAKALQTAPATGEVVVHVDDALFSGPAVSPDWPASYVGSGVVSPVSALSVDAGRVRRGSVARERDPAIAAGRDLVRLLTARGLKVNKDVTRTAAPAGARTLAEVQSPTIAELVERDLATSDNDLAEALLRLVAVASNRPGTFADGTAAVVDVLTELEVPTDGMDLLDGSGLARGSAVPPETLARLLAFCATGPAELRPVVSGLPVAAFSGTLAFRFGSSTTAAGAGVVRAKTGTLTGVSTLAGVTVAGGRPLIFVAMSDNVPANGTLVAREALDRFASALAGT
jgi:D-alanyl-D-alanine carboxypeptidase/D-alanyl-D-alanine-endopeptidase (penicillin-binding protein 4)